MNETQFELGRDYVVDKSLNMFGTDVDESIFDTPGMLSRYERQMLFSIAKQIYSGSGYIVDGGSFFGSSVCSLASGLQSNAAFENIMKIFGYNERKPIVAYELGYLPAPKSEKIDRRRVFGGKEYYLGDSFVDILRESVAPYKNLIDLRIGDFMEQNWKHDDDIELCFIDFAKTKYISKKSVQDFFPRFIPGTTILIHQDFYFDRLPWLKVQMGQFRDCFRWMGQVATSAIFQCIAPISEEMCEHDAYLEGSFEEAAQYHQMWDGKGLSEKCRYMLEISYCYLLALFGHREEALEMLGNVENTYPDLVVPEGQRNVVRTHRARRQITSGRMNM